MEWDDGLNGVLVTQFGVMSRWFPLPAESKVSMLNASDLAAAVQQSPGAKCGSQAALSEVVPEGKGLQWPNRISRHKEWLVIPDGFLVPGKSNGNIFLSAAPVPPQVLAGELHAITAKKSGHFYHMVKWYDFNGDGEEDILTARCIMGGASSGMPASAQAGKFAGELVVLLNPGRDKMVSAEWEERVVAHGPDIIIAVEPHRGGLAVFCAEFFGERLTVRFLSSAGEEKAPALRVIDDTIGRVFAVDIVDLDGDGNEELLVTNHVSNESISGVFAYELPPRAADGTRDLEGGNFTKHVLTRGFKTKFSLLPGAASPGFAYAFHPSAEDAKSGNPRHVLVEGDGSHEVVLLSPNPGAGRFQYSRSLVEDLGGTVGSLLVRDVTGDGIVDVFAANNDDGKVSMFTFERTSAVPAISI